MKSVVTRIEEFLEELCDAPTADLAGTRYPDTGPDERRCSGHGPHRRALRIASLPRSTAYHELNSNSTTKVDLAIRLEFLGSSEVVGSRSPLSAQSAGAISWASPAASILPHMPDRAGVEHKLVAPCIGRACNESAARAGLLCFAVRT